MCLYTDSKKVQVAKEDITCYKILIKERKKWIYRIFHKSTYRAPFYKYHTYRLKELNDLGRSLIVYTDYEVHSGFHSFVNLQDAERMLSEWYDTQKGQIIVQCVIPKGAEYVKGTIDKSPTSPASYVSHQIICLREI